MIGGRQWKNNDSRINEFRVDYEFGRNKLYREKYINNCLFIYLFYREPAYFILFYF